eukprot:3634358-Lingulodinium_polyedra.AAC.1
MLCLFFKTNVPETSVRFLHLTVEEIKSFQSALERARRVAPAADVANDAAPVPEPRRRPSRGGGKGGGAE